MTDGRSNLSDFTAVQRVLGDLSYAVDFAMHGMLAASSIGIFLVPMLYVTFQRWREAAKKRFGGKGKLAEAKHSD